MTWQVENGADGPVWSGQDSVFDFAWLNKEQRYWGTGVGGLILAFLVAWTGPLIVASMAAKPFNGWTAQVIFDCIGALALVTTPAALWWTWREMFKRRPKPGQFLCRDWTLTASAAGFACKAGSFNGRLDPFEVSRNKGDWAVKLDDVARVEVGHTQQWIPMRRYHGFDFGTDAMQSVPPHEVQAFLFLADGSRRVIYTGNSDLEGAGALAHSVRSWLEEMKARPPVQPQAANGAREGFDI